VFVLLLLEFDVEDALTNCQFTQFFDLLKVVLGCFLVDHLQPVEDAIVEVGILVVCEVVVVDFVQMPELALELP
jgi:hypothetical protein